MRNIRKLSTIESTPPHAGSAVVMVGSFAPIHLGHFDAIRAAGNAIQERGIQVDNVVLSPNSDEYLERKLKGEKHDWTYDRRVSRIASGELPIEGITTYVDDVSGRIVGLNEINRQVPYTLHHLLGLAAEQLYFVTGSDQIRSMEAYLSDPARRAICVLRPDGGLNAAHRELGLPWARQAIDEGRYIVTEREDMENDISSSAIRRASA